MESNRKKDRNIKEVLSDFGFAFEFFKAIAYAVLRRNGSGKDMKRAISDATLADKIADLLVIKKSTAIGSAFSACRAIVSYHTPAYNELRSAFDSVGNEFEGIAFEAIESRKDANRRPREVEFGYVDLNCRENCGVCIDEIYSEFQRRDLLPALYEESLAYGLTFPDVQRYIRVAALGSITKQNGYRQVAVMGGDNSVRSLCLESIDYGVAGRYRFLGVKK